MKTGLFQRLSIGRRSAPGSVAVQAEALAQLHRNALAAFTALISAYWIGPGWATAWFALILIHEYFTVATVTRVKIVPHFKSDPAQARRWLIGVSAWGCCLYALGWFPSFVTGAPGSGYFAAVCIACAMIHAIVYTRKDPLVFAAYLVPTLLFSTIGGFICYGFTLLPFVLMLISARLALSTIIGMRDRTALYDSIKDNKVRREAAERASAAKTEFLATMSHELRTPLNAVIGYAEIVQEDLESGAARPEDVERIHKAARGLLAMIEDVLDYSQLETGKISRHDRDTDLRTLLESEAERARAEAALHGTRIEVRCEVVGALPLDGEHLRQALRKLISNACKFTANGVITLEAERDASTLSIAVADTGTGISPQAQARLFRPFEQAESGKTRGHDGAGLGLAIVARLAALMGGAISLDSAPGAGARFVLTLPMQAQATPAAPLARVA